jgi:hypothetical protein
MNDATLDQSLPLRVISRNAHGIASGHQPVTIVLDLVNPLEPDGGRSAGGQARLYECGSTQHAAHLGGGGQDSNRETAGPSRMPRRDAAEPAGAFHDWANLNLAKRRLCDALGTSLGSAAHCCAISVARVRATLTASIPPIEPPLGPTRHFRRSKKLLPRHFHDPPPDGQSHRRLE